MKRNQYSKDPFFEKPEKCYIRKRFERNRACGDPDNYRDGRHTKDKITAHVVIPMAIGMVDTRKNIQ